MSETSDATLPEADYRVNLDKFEGPLDLLLYLIKREEVDIYDIPILRITEQFIGYVDLISELNLDRAGEFMVTASMLMEIKSRMLLPDESEDEDGEVEDPRHSLVKQLLEYRKFKQRTRELEKQFDDHSLRFPRPGKVVQVPEEQTVDLGNIEMFDLFAAFKKIMQDVTPQQLIISGDIVSAAEHMYLIVDAIKARKNMQFKELFPKDANRPYMAGVFIGILELSRQKKIICYQTNNFGDIRLCSPEFHRDSITDLDSFNRLQGKKVTVMGLGHFNGGTSLVRYMAEHHAEVTVSDCADAEALSKPMKQLEDCKVTYHLGEHRESDFTTAERVFVSPAVKPDAPELALAYKHEVELDTDINYFLKHTPAEIIGVTGSNGKTTTATLLGDMFKRDDEEVLIAGNMGAPFLHRLDYLNNDHSVILEFSSFQLSRLDWVGISPRVAIITNLTDNHLDWHKTRTEYLKAKYNLLRFQSQKDLAVLNADDPTLKEWGERCPGNVVWFSTRTEVDGYFLRDEQIICRNNGEDKSLLDVNLLRLPGEHNLSNLLAAVAAAHRCDIPMEHIKAAISGFKTLPHRLQTIATINGVRYINDSKSTTPAALAAGASSTDSPTVLLAGGYDKGPDFKCCADLPNHNLKAAVLYGATAKKIGRHLKKAMEARDKKLARQVTYVDTFDQAFKLASELVTPGDILLLSPGSASFDEFANYEERGKVFEERVKALNQTPPSPPNPETEQATQIENSDSNTTENN